MKSKMSTVKFDKQTYLFSRLMLLLLIAFPKRCRLRSSDRVILTSQFFFGKIFNYDHVLEIQKGQLQK